jgi:hypothetical protein
MEVRRFDPDLELKSSKHAKGNALDTGSNDAVNVRLQKQVVDEEFSWASTDHSDVRVVLLFMLLVKAPCSPQPRRCALVGSR